MNIKQVAAVTLIGLALPMVSFAHGNIWYDKGSHLPQYKKLVLFPVMGIDGNYWYDDKNEKSDEYEANNYINTRFTRKLKIKNVISLGTPLTENKSIRAKDKEVYPKLLVKFPSDKEKAATVSELIAAEGYLQPRIAEDRKEYHKSPATTVNVQMRSYTEVKDGPNGDKKYNQRTWTVKHTVPETTRCLYHMQVEHEIFDRDGKKVLTYKNGNHTYKYEGNESHYKLKMFKDLVDEFRDDYSDIKKEYLEDKEKDDDRIPVRIGFKNIDVPQNVGENEYWLKSVHFVMKNFALKHTKAKIIFDSESLITPKYYVEGKISRFTYDRTWSPPTAGTRDVAVSSEKRKWKDKNGKEHTMTTTNYTSSIYNVYGRWNYRATVIANFSLVNARTGQVVVNHSSYETDDKRADAYRHFMKDFYEKVQKYLKKTEKSLDD